MRKFICVLLLLFLFTSCTAPKPPKPKELRGIWVASVLNLDYPSKPGLDTKTLQAEAVSLLDSAEELGLNAVFLQVRPCCDAIYPSKYFPWSKYVTGIQGNAPQNFDPLKFWILEAHKRKIQIHAWINPFRVTQGGKVDGLASNNPAVLHPDWTVKYKDGNLYLNPGIPAVREYICNGIREIVDTYEVDGIHFDDYFYPGESFEDDAQYQGSNLNRDDWRRQNVDDLIRDTAEIARKSNVMFGVSPFGIWQNKDSSPLGSDTRGLESYRSHYADTYKWVKNDWVDYIAPQIYWHIGNDVADYEKLLNWWAETVRGTNVRLFIGHAGYRSLDAKPGEVWYGGDELMRQMEMNRKFPEVSGSIHFRLGTYLQTPALVQALKTEYTN